MSPNNTANHNGLNYADAGVDIDAGNALVEAIKKKFGGEDPMFSTSVVPPAIQGHTDLRNSGALSRFSFIGVIG